MQPEAEHFKFMDDGQCERSVICIIDNMFVCMWRLCVKSEPTTEVYEDEPIWFWCEKVKGQCGSSVSSSFRLDGGNYNILKGNSGCYDGPVFIMTSCYWFVFQSIR